MIKLLKTKKGMIIMKVSIAVTSGRERQAEGKGGKGEEQMGGYVFADVLVLDW